MDKLTDSQKRLRLKKLKAQFYNPINRKSNGKPLASTYAIQKEIHELKRDLGLFPFSEDSHV